MRWAVMFVSGRSHSRKPGNRRPGSRLYILTEGAVTEREYFCCIRERLGIAKELVTIKKAQCTDPNGMVDEAIKLKKKNAIESYRGNDVVVDRWWIVLDSECQYSNMRDALMKAKKNGILLAVSDPSIELWLLLHFRYTTAAYDSASQLIEELSKSQLLPGYGSRNKKPKMDVLYPRIHEAVRNARRLRSSHTCKGNTHPLTDVDLLLDDLAAQASPGNRPEYAHDFDSGELFMNRAGY